MSQLNILAIASENPDDPDGADRRQAILEHNLPFAQRAIREATEKDQVVVVLDLSPVCLFSQLMLKALSPTTPDEQQRHANQCKRDGTIPNVVVMMPRWSCLKLMRKVQKFMHANDNRDPAASLTVEELSIPAPSGFFYCFAISRGKQLGVVPTSEEERSTGVEELCHNVEFSTPCRAWQTSVAVRGQHRISGFFG